MAGITMNAMASQGFTTRLIYSMASLQEVTLDYSGNTAEVPTGGVRINIIPREGGNTFNGTFFSSIATARCRRTISPTTCGARGCARRTRSGSCGT